MVKLPRQGGTAILDTYGMLYFVNQNNEITHTDNHLKKEIADPVELKMTADNDGRVWIYGDKGLWVYNSITAEWENSPLSDLKNRPIVRAVAQDKNGNLGSALTMKELL